MGSSTVTSPAWLPWLLWMVIACIVSTSASREVAKSLPMPAIGTRSRSPSDRHAGVAVEQAEAAIVGGDQHRRPAYHSRPSPAW